MKDTKIKGRSAQINRIGLIWICVFAMLCTIAPIQAEAASARMNKSSLYLIKGQKYFLKTKGIQGNVKWSSGKKSVATVSEKGKVTAKKKGTTIVKAKVGNNTYKCKVSVYNKYSDGKLCKMAKKYYQDNGTYGSWMIIEVDSKDGDNVTIHVYEKLSDHTATTDWLYINAKTGAGSDFFGKMVDLKKYAN